MQFSLGAKNLLAEGAENPHYSTTNGPYKTGGSLHDDDAGTRAVGNAARTQPAS